MRAFAIPAYHDARIRLNVKGREAEGIIAPSDYRRALQDIAGIIKTTTEIPSGRPLDVDMEFVSPSDPFAVNDWQTDIVVRFKRNAPGFLHPVLGPIGPVPYRRTGGHTGGYGIALVAGPDIAAGPRGVASTFDVAPLIIDLVRARVGGAVSAITRALG